MSSKDAKDKEAEKYLSDFVKSNTHKKYKTAVTRLIEYLEDKNIPPDKVGDNEMIDYYIWLKDRIAESTIKSYMFGAGRFYNYLIGKGVVTKNPFCSITKKVKDRNILTIFRLYLDDFINENNNDLRLKSQVIKLLRYLDNKDIRLEKVGDKQAADYYLWLTMRKLKKDTIKYTLFGAKRFYTYLIKKGVCKQNPFKAVMKKLKEKMLPDTFTSYLYAFLKDKKISKENEKNKKTWLIKYFYYLDERNLEVKAACCQTALEYKNWLTGQNYTLSHVNNLITVCVHFYNYLLKEKAVKSNPFSSLARKERLKQINEKYPYLEDYLKGFKKTIKNNRRSTLIKLFKYLKKRKLKIDNIGKKQAAQYITWVGSHKNLSQGTKNNNIKDVITFYYYLKDRGVVHTNPFTKEDKKELYQKPELIIHYEDEERQRGLRERTIKSYTGCLKTYFKYLDCNGLDAGEIRAAGALEYLKYLVTEKKADKTVIAYHHEALKSFYNFLFRKKLIYANPFKGLKKMRTHKRIPRNLPKEKEMDELLEKTLDFNTGTRHRRIKKYKLHVLFELLYSTGMRISEAAGLKAEDIDFDKGIVHIIGGKGGKTRIALLNDYAKEVLRIYVKMMPALHDDNYKRNDTLFGVGAGRLEIMANEELKQYGEYTTHFFRHSVGYHLLKAGCDIRYIQEILGHESLSSTEIYTKVDL